jgi:predicted RNase H-like HicB family nuclease
MSTRTFTAIIRRENGGYVANSPEAGLITHGATIEEALAKLKEETRRVLDGAALLDVDRPLMTTYDFDSSEETTNRQFFTAKELLESGLVGLWADRTDIGDSVEFAQQLRERAQRREHE